MWLERRRHTTSVSIGLAVVPGHGGDLAALSEAADRALSRARAEGRGLIVVASDEDVLAAVGTPQVVQAPASRAS